MKDIKRIKLIACAAAVAVTGIGGVFAFASCGEDDMGLEYELKYGVNGEYYAVVGFGDFEGGELKIPSKYKGVSVAVIGDGTDLKKGKVYDVTSIIIPDSVTEIGDYAFNACAKLTSVALGENVKTIGDYAFSNCSALEKVVLPDSLTSLGDYAFYECKTLTELMIGSGLKKIPNEAFGGSALTNLVIPSTTKEIGEWAFGGVPLTELIISEGVESIDMGAFYKVNVESVVIPASVTYIGKQAFSWNLNLKSAEFKAPEGWTAVREANGLVYGEMALSADKVSDSAYMAEFFKDDLDAEYDGTPEYTFYTLYKD